MALFSDAQLAEMANYFADLACKDDVTILRSARTPDGQLGSRETFELHETVKCLVISSGNPRLELVAQQTVGRDDNLFCFPVGTDVDRTDRLSYQGDTYEIIDLLDPSTYTVFLRVLAKHMEAGAGI
jgi:hypothetical protein